MLRIFMVILVQYVCSTMLESRASISNKISSSSSFQYSLRLRYNVLEVLFSSFYFMLA